MIRSVHDVEQFVVGKLKEQIQLDLKELRMVREADLECCVYYHFRNFFGEDPSWKILARKYSRTGRYVDFLIFRETVPQFAIELKWNAATMPKKDRESLRRCWEKLGIHKAYFITTHYSRKEFQKIVKKDTLEKHHIFESVIDLPDDDQRADWRELRRKYTKYMEPRKRKRDAVKRT